MIRKLLLRILSGMVVCGGLGVLALHFYFASLLTSAPPPYEPIREPFAYYFAYGSNMSPQYLTNIRNVRSQWSSASILQDYAVQFSLPGLARLEPAFANVTPQQGAEAYGVVHRLSLEGLETIKGSEGEGYHWRQVDVHLASGESVSAWTLVAKPAFLAQAPPSRRYLGVMYAAAVYFDFPEAQQERLNPERGAYIPVLSEVIGVFIQSAVWLAARI